MVKDILELMGNWAYLNAFCDRYTAKQNQGKTLVGITPEDFFNFFKDNGYKYEKWGNWSNDVIQVRTNYYEDESFTCQSNLSYMHRISIANSKTGFCLKYKQQEPGAFLTNFFYEKCTDWDGTPKKLSYSNPTDWKEEFFKVFKTMLDETTTRITLKNKKDSAKDSLQQIENEIDYAIMDAVDEMAGTGVYLKKVNNEINSVTITYNIRKDILNLYKNPYLSIRKLKNGKYTMQYKNYEYYDADLTTWAQIKDGTTPDQIKQFIKDYFAPWLGMKDIIYTKPTFL